MRNYARVVEGGREREEIRKRMPECSFIRNRVRGKAEENSLNFLITENIPKTTLWDQLASKAGESLEGRRRMVWTLKRKRRTSGSRDKKCKGQTTERRGRPQVQ